MNLDDIDISDVEVEYVGNKDVTDYVIKQMKKLIQIEESLHVV
jgi:hypothetical protein